MALPESASIDPDRPVLPRPRGPVSASLLAHLTSAPHPLPLAPEPRGPAGEDDLQLSLYVCYELHYRGFAGVGDDWEWEPSLLALRSTLERQFLTDLMDEVGPPPAAVRDVGSALAAVIAEADGPSLSAYVSDEGTLDHLREFAVHRSAYQLKEADPHTWAIPRLHGRAKAAMVAIQADEYGNGDPARMHSALFSRTMEALGLSHAYGDYLDLIPATTLATVNLASFMGLHRRWRGALVGHLALFEMTSVGPMGRYGDAFRRLGLDDSAYAFYDVHVEADAAHELVAAGELAGGLVAEDPRLAGDVVFGARTLMAVESRFTRELLGCWRRGRSSLVGPVSRRRQVSGLG